MHRTKSKDKPPGWAASFVGSKLPHNISQCVATGVEVVIDLARAFSSFFETHGAGEILKSLRTGTHFSSTRVQAEAFSYCKISATDSCPCHTSCGFRHC
jgi:hypothetical protein